MTRGIFVYLPPIADDGVIHFYREFRGLLLSWAILRSKQPKDMKTDMVVATTNANFDRLGKIGCQLNKARTDG